MHIIDTLPGEIKLGQQNEHGVSEVEFDITAWVALYPTGAAVIAANPGVSDGLWMTYTRNAEADVYPVDAADLALSTVGLVNVLTWTVQEAVTALGGQGTAVIHCTEDGDEKRSRMTQTVVTDGHAAATTPPEPLADYIAKWGAVDIVVSAVAHDTVPTGGITQNETGTHITLNLVDGESAYDQAVTGGYTGTLEGFYDDLVGYEGAYAAQLAAETAETNASSSASAAAASALQLASGVASPAGWYDDLAALNAGNPAHDKTYGTKNDWKFAFWDAGTSAFVAGGVYQATAIADGYVSPRKTIFFDGPVNLFNPETITAVHYLNHATGGLVDNADFFTSDFIAVDPAKSYIISTKTFTAQYDSSHAFIADSGTIGQVTKYTFTPVATAAYIKFSEALAALSLTLNDVIFTEEGTLDYTFKERYIPRLSVNMFDPLTITDNKYDSGGTLVGHADFFTSDYIAVDPARKYIISSETFSAQYTASKAFIAGTWTGAHVLNYILTPDANAAYVRFSEVHNLYGSVDDFEFVEWTSFIHVHIANEVMVKAGGTPGVDCDYVKLTDAIAYAYATGNITVRVLAGTYNIVTELSSMAGAGPLVGNGMHLIFSPQAYIECNYTGGDDAVEIAFSPLNAGIGDFIIEELNISCSNVRYCFHDELSGALGFRRHEYKNCTMYIDNRNSSQAAVYKACFGGGLGQEEYILIEGGYYKSETSDGDHGATILWHAGDVAGAKSEIIIRDVYFDGALANCRFGYYGVSTEITKCYVSNCSMTVAPVVIDETGSEPNVNMELIAWNNEVRV